MGSNEVVVVTGASSGIGSATAAALGQAGYRVALGARRVERLEEVAQTVESAGGSAFAHALDVTESSSQDSFWRRFGPIGVRLMH